MFPPVVAPKGVGASGREEATRNVSAETPNATRTKTVDAAPSRSHPLPVPARPRPRVFYRIGEVARLVGVSPQALRHWEQVLGVPRPMKTTGSHRHYRRHDVELAMRVRAMLESDGLTLAGVKKRLALGTDRKRSDPQTTLVALRAELEALLDTTRAHAAPRVRRAPVVVPGGG